MKKFVELRTKTYSYLIDDGNEDKNVKSTKKCIMEKKIEFEDYQHCLKAT